MSEAPLGLEGFGEKHEVGLLAPARLWWGVGVWRRQVQCSLLLLSEKDVLSGRGIRSGVAEGAPERVMRAWAGGWPSSLWQAEFAREVGEWRAWVHSGTGGLLLKMNTPKNAWALLGTRGQAWWLLAPKGMLSFLPTSLLPLATSSTASWHGIREKGRLFWKRAPACCQLCWWTQFLNLPEQSVLTHLHELGSQSQLLSVSNTNPTQS